MSFHKEFMGCAVVACGGVGAFAGWVYGSLEGMGFLGALGGAAFFAGCVLVIGRALGWAGTLRSDYRILGDGTGDTFAGFPVDSGDGGGDAGGDGGGDGD